jgi:hypothetical protein
MAKPNYSYQKRQKELEKQKKQEEKRQKRLAKRSDDAQPDEEAPSDNETNPE